MYERTRSGKAFVFFSFSAHGMWNSQWPYNECKRRGIVCKLNTSFVWLCLYEERRRNGRRTFTNLFVKVFQRTLGLILEQLESFHLHSLRDLHPCLYTKWYIMCVCRLPEPTGIPTWYMIATVLGFLYYPGTSEDDWDLRGEVFISWSYSLILSFYQINPKAHLEFHRSLLSATSSS